MRSIVLSGHDIRCRFSSQAFAQTTIESSVMRFILTKTCRLTKISPVQAVTPLTSFGMTRGYS